MASILRALLLLLAVSALCLTPPDALAATRLATDCTSSSVSSAIDAAVSGDTVKVPAGSCTWAAPIALPDTKDLWLSGNGIASTIITCTGGCLVVPTSVTTRISGFAFVHSGPGEMLIEIGHNSNPGPGKTFRVDHNAFTSVSSWSFVEVFGGGPNIGKHPTGLVDHNTFNGVAVHVNGSNFLRHEGTAQDDLWSQGTALGDGIDVVYIEDNTFTGDRPNYVDGNYGARWVFRFNTTSGHSTGMEVHSVQGDNRAVQRWEMYKNVLGKSDVSFWPVAFIRGGTGVVFGNRASANFTNDLLIDNVRSMRDPGEGVGACDGSSNWDENAGPLGYACRDQIGRGRDTVLWAPGGAYTQPLQPVYFWDNIKGTSTPLSVLINKDCPDLCPRNELHLVENRDWYTESPSFTGAEGVGRGLLAARPATCTAGVAYWAIDQGEWNSLQPGPDGQLYKCTATNTWTPDYKPFTYPHPLQQGALNPPAAPSGLTVR
jgi:hypothetical protein